MFIFEIILFSIDGYIKNVTNIMQLNISDPWIPKSFKLSKGFSIGQNT